MDVETLVISRLDLFDLILRFCAIGQLFLLALYLWFKQHASHRWIKTFLLICVTAYILLTTTIPNYYYGYFRYPLLFLTDLTSYALWLFSACYLRNNFSIRTIPFYLKIIALLWFLWLAYFFLIHKGDGFFHQIHHLIGLCIMLLIMLEAALGYRDDLVAKRRRLRQALVVFCSSYMFVLTLFEITLTGLKDTWQFSLINAGGILLAVGIISLFAIINNNEIADSNLTTEKSPNTVTSQTLTLSQQKLHKKIQNLMEAGFYQTNGLTINMLATELGLPEHQLRVFINQVLGFNNFSHFLNSYRLPAACSKFSDPTFDKLPILSIALELGFGSIAPFNRSFKEFTGVTPSEYRKNIQNR